MAEQTGRVKWFDEKRASGLSSVKMVMTYLYISELSLVTASRRSPMDRKYNLTLKTDRKALKPLTLSLIHI